ncbi:hypothetical protein F5B19DRAFT_455438 [Rostrohypoxylon terebratum]|nr:hypothetical protein F5B19DRAFT_455438 [Rostrohypoxylon terebratum]
MPPSHFMVFQLNSAFDYASTVATCGGGGGGGSWLLLNSRRFRCLGPALLFLLVLVLVEPIPMVSANCSQKSRWVEVWAVRVRWGSPGERSASLLEHLGDLDRLLERGITCCPCGVGAGALLVGRGHC